ncbi:coxsackievirus and adenovirus receptor homolog, partial [Chiloscyllium punctatum]|uniref:coxsackievirus and adenovirus receptor homolog n=1 Tax=Chiloscyllium punctatum TaxID=137246 RepID=UPI003B6346EA
MPGLVKRPVQSASLSGSHLTIAHTLVYLGWTIAGVTNAVRITSAGPQTLHMAERGSINISCRFELDSNDLGSLDIEWTVMSPDTTKLDQVVLTYVHEEVYEYPSPLSGRITFLEADPSGGIASVQVTSLRTTDTNTFQCKVKKAPGIDSRKVTVEVH